MATNPSLTHPMLVTFKTALERDLAPEMQEPTTAIVRAGMQLLYSPSTHGKVLEVYQEIQKQQFSPNAIANGLVGLLGLVYQGSKGRMSMEAALPAASILACYVLDDLAQLHGMEITKDLFRETIGVLGTKLYTLFGAGEQDGQPAQPGAPPVQPGAAEPPGLAQTVPPTPQGAV